MVTLGTTAGPLTLALDPAADFVDRIELRTAAGVPTPWPAGTTAWLRFTLRGHSFERLWPATITGALMEWVVAAAEVAEIPRRAWVELWLDYPDSPASVWLAGQVEFGCRRVGIGYIAAVPGAGPGVVAVPVPGPAGPPGGGALDRVVLTGVAAGPLSGHRAVYRRPDGLIDYASAATPAHFDAPIWITTGAVAAGATATMVAFGEITEASWAWTPARLIFLGAGGALTQTVPSAPGSDFLAVLGAAPTPTSMFVNRQPSINLI
jgi:hypothetical protein